MLHFDHETVRGIYMNIVNYLTGEAQRIMLVTEEFIPDVLI